MPCAMYLQNITEKHHIRIPKEMWEILFYNLYCNKITQFTVPWTWSQSTHLSKNRTWHNNDPCGFKKAESIEGIWLCVTFLSSCNCLFWQTNWRENKHCSFSLATSYPFQPVKCAYHGLKQQWKNTIPLISMLHLLLLWNGKIRDGTTESKIY